MELALDIFKYLLSSLNDQDNKENVDLLNKIKSFPEVHDKLLEYTAAIDNRLIDIKQFEKQIDSFNAVLLKFAQHNYTVQNEINYDNEIIDSLALSINFLGEELNYSTITKYYLEDVFDSMKDMLIVIDKQGFICFVNNSCISILKYEKEYLLRNSISIILEEGINVDTLINNKYFTKNIFFISKDNLKIPVFIKISSFLRGDEQEIGSIIIARDMTEQKRVEEELLKLNEQLEIRVKERTEELSRSEYLYDSTINSINDGVYVIDKNYNILFVNQYLKNFLLMNGFSDNIDGKPVRKIFNYYSEDDYNMIKWVFEYKKELIYDTKHLIFGAEYFSKKVLTPIIENNEVARIVITEKDKTESEKIKEEIIKNLEREKELNQLRSQFISTVSHEFRTPLAGIFSGIQLLEKYGDNWSNERKIKLYNQVKVSVQQAKNILDDTSIMNIAQNNKLILKREIINLENMLYQIFEENIRVFDNKHKVNFTCHFISKNQYFDPFSIRYILNNIISNAFKYCGKRYEIDFNVIEKTSGDIIFAIQDFGIGIPKSDQKNLFEAFYRASNVEGIQGTGIGLSIVKKYIELYKGSIKVDSEIGKGTKITIVLPTIKE